MKHLIESLRKKGKRITPQAVAVESLFHAGGTVTEAEARTYIEAELERVSMKAAKKEDGTGLGYGFAAAVARLSFLNEIAAPFPAIDML